MTTLNFLHRDSLHEGGFAGLKEHHLVTDRAFWGKRADPDAWDGLGNFVYMADATFNPKGETTMHPHKEIDVISIMVEGRITHLGSLEHGSSLNQNEIQVQRAGGEGFRHNEVNPDDTRNRMLQLWVKPEVSGEPAGYKLFSPQSGETIRVYGGLAGQTESFPAQTFIDVAMLREGQAFQFGEGELVYVAKGSGRLEDQTLAGGTLMRGPINEIVATSETQIVRIGTIT